MTASALSPDAFPCGCKGGLTRDTEYSNDWICDECMAHWTDYDFERFRKSLAVQSDAKTLRDEMAMSALNGLLSASADHTINGRALENEQDYAVLSYALADEMMEARKK